MNNKILLGIIVLIAVAAFAIVSWRAPSNQQASNLTPTVTPTPTEENPFEPTDEITDTPTPTTTTNPTSTPTSTPTVTATPTPTTSDSSTFSSDAHSSYVYGVQQQKVGSSVYFIDATDKTKIRKGSSTSDTAAKTVYKSDSTGEIGSFVVNGSYMYVAQKKDSSNNTKLMRMVLSTSAKATMFRYESPKYEITQFSVPKDNNTKAGFYLGLQAAADNAEPNAIYISNYTIKWTKTFTGAGKTADLKAMSLTKDKTKLMALLGDGSTVVKITLVTPTPTVTP